MNLTAFFAELERTYCSSRGQDELYNAGVFRAMYQKMPLSLKRGIVTMRTISVLGPFMKRKTSEALLEEIRMALTEMAREAHEDGLLPSPVEFSWDMLVKKPLNIVLRVRTPSGEEAFTDIRELWKDLRTYLEENGIAIRGDFRRP